MTHENRLILIKAQEYHRDGNITDAEKYYQLHLNEHPNDASALHAFAILLAQNDHLAEARDTILRAIKIDSDNPAFYNSLGNIYRHQSDFQKATRAFEQATQLNPCYAIAYNNLGNVYFKKNEFHLAKKYYQNAIALAENYIDAHLNLGIVLAQLHEDALAVTHLKHVLALKPNTVSALNQLSDLYLRAEKHIDAQKLLIRCLSLSPDNISAHYQCGVCLFKQKEFAQANQHFATVLMQDHLYLEINQYHANTYLELGEHDKALHYYFRQLEKEPLFETYYNLGVLFMMKEKLNDALTYFNEALIINHDDLATQLNCGHIYLKKKQLQKAIIHYEKALSLRSSDTEIQHILSALKKTDVPNKAPAAYIAHLFNQYAPYYEAHLTKYLEYGAPQKLLEAIILYCGSLENNAWTMVDLGCGTGLCGAQFKPFAKKLIGVDLSEQMLLVARAKNIYDELIQADIIDALSHLQHMDVILAADVFTYMGDLDVIFKYAKNALVSSGLFAFTVEKTFDQPFILQVSIRYAHSKAYIDTLIEKYDFKTIRFDNLSLRRQHSEMIAGYLVILKAA